MDNSWVIGDRDSDIECGKRAGVRTILIKGKQTRQKRENAHPDFSTDNLRNAVNIISRFK